VWRSGKGRYEEKQWVTKIEKSKYAYYCRTWGGGCVLGDENRMPPHRCLLAIVLWSGRCNPGIYKLVCVIFDGFEAFGGDVIPIFRGQFEFGSEFGLFQRSELLGNG